MKKEGGKEVDQGGFLQWRERSVTLPEKAMVPWKKREKKSDISFLGRWNIFFVASPFCLFVCLFSSSSSSSTCCDSRSRGAFFSCKGFGGFEGLDSWISFSLIFFLFFFFFFFSFLQQTPTHLWLSLFLPLVHGQPELVGSNLFVFALALDDGWRETGSNADLKGKKSTQHALTLLSLSTASRLSAYSRFFCLSRRSESSLYPFSVSFSIFWNRMLVFKNKNKNKNKEGQGKSPPWGPSWGGTG